MSNTNKIANRISNFKQRWDLLKDENSNNEEFKLRCLNSFCKILGQEFCFNNNLEKEFSHIVGIHDKNYNILTFATTKLKFNIQETLAYKTLESQENLVNILFIIEAITLIESLNNNLKILFIDEVLENVLLSSININAIKIENEIIFYPKGAKSLDEELIDNNLNWLKNYNDAYLLFKKALYKIDNNDNERNIIDDLRLSLESFLKQKLSNSKSLDNQINEIGIFLGKSDTSQEITNLFF